MTDQTPWAPPSPQPQPTPKRRGLFRRALPWLVAVAALFVGIAIGAAGGDTPAASPATSAARPTADPAAVDARQNERKTQLDAREAELNRREDELKIREAALQTQEAAVKENTIPGEGLYVVGQDVKAGTYRTAGPSGRPCYYAIKNGTGADADILDNNIIEGAGSVTIKDGQVFETKGCQDWTLVQ